MLEALNATKDAIQDLVDISGIQGIDAPSLVRSIQMAMEMTDLQLREHLGTGMQ
jgi:hypothetical protein